MRDHARLARKLDQRVRFRQPTLSRRRCALDHPDAQPGELQGDPLAGASFDAAGLGAAGSVRTGATHQRATPSERHPTHRLPSAIGTPQRRSVASRSSFVSWWAGSGTLVRKARASMSGETRQSTTTRRSRATLACRRTSRRRVSVTLTPMVTAPPGPRPLCLSEPLSGRGLAEPPA